MGYEAVSSTAQKLVGEFGAGMGAKAGTLKGGMGSVSLMDDEGNIVGALSVSNPFGSVTLPDESSSGPGLLNAKASLADFLLPAWNHPCL